MKNTKTFVAVVVPATSFGPFTTQTVTATGSAPENTKAEIAAQAEYTGASNYKITQAYTGNRMHMTAELLKQNTLVLSKGHP